MATPAQQDIIERLGLQDLPEATQLSLLMRMTETVIKKITVEVLERLSDEDREKIFDLQAKEDLEGVEKLLREKVPEYDEIAEKAAREFADDMQETVAMLKKSS